MDGSCGKFSTNYCISIVLLHNYSATNQCNCDKFVRFGDSAGINIKNGIDIIHIYGIILTSTLDESLQNDKKTSEHCAGVYLKELQEELLRRTREGSDEAFEALAKMYAPLISSMASSFRATGAGALDELLEEARSALLKAALRYDSTQQKVSFGLYAKICIRNALISQRRKALCRARREERVPTRRKTARGFYRVENTGEEQVLMARIETLLSGYEKKVLGEYVSGKTAAQIAAALGRDKKSVSNALFRIRTKVKTLHSDGEFEE